MLIDLKEYELQALIDWHIAQKRAMADDEEFIEAEDHRKRALELAQIAERKRGV